MFNKKNQHIKSEATQKIVTTNQQLLKPFLKENQMPVKVVVTDKQIKDGKDTLRQLRIEGREVTVGFGECVDMMTPIIAPQHPAATIQNLRSVVFHRNEDGWFVLFLLKKVRKGLPEVFGTPSDRPCETYEAAYTQACITVGLLLNAKRLGIRPGSKATGKIPDAIREMILTTY